MATATRSSIGFHEQASLKTRRYCVAAGIRDCQSTMADTGADDDELTGTMAISASRRWATSKSRIPGASSTGTADVKLAGELFVLSTEALAEVDSVARMIVDPRRNRIDCPSRLQRGFVPPANDTRTRLPSRRF